MLARKRERENVLLCSSIAAVLSPFQGPEKEEKGPQHIKKEKEREKLKCILSMHAAKGS